MVFKDREKLRTMLSLRQRGWTYKSLALIFGVDHSSIYKACKIRGVTKKHEDVVFDISNIVGFFIEPFKEKVTKTYADYLNEQHRRSHRSSMVFPMRNN